MKVSVRGLLPVELVQQHPEEVSEQVQVFAVVVAAAAALFELVVWPDSPRCSVLSSGFPRQRTRNRGRHTRCTRTRRPPGMP